MLTDLIIGLALPFVGTALGSGGALIIRKKPGDELEQILNGFAGGVMMAACVWSLLIPAINHCAALGKLSFLPAVIGLWIGIIFLFVVDKTDSFIVRILKSRSLSHKTALLVLAVTVHNLPEGMAVGAVYAGLLSGETGVSVSEAFALALGIALQNFPEGAIISMPLYANGMSRFKAFVFGVLSGAVEPVAAGLTVILSSFVFPLLPLFLGFAAGAMVYTVASEILPATAGETKGVISFASGFTLMMILDVALG